MASKIPNTRGEGDPYERGDESDEEADSSYPGTNQQVRATVLDFTLMCLRSCSRSPSPANSPAPPLCASAQGTPVPYARSPRPTVANAPTPTASCVAVPANLIVPSEFGTLPVLLPSPGGSTASAACATSIPYLAARVPDGAAPARARHAPSFSLFLNFLYLLSFIAAAISVGWMQRDSLLGTDAWWDTVDTGST